MKKGTMKAGNVTNINQAIQHLKTKPKLHPGQILDVSHRKKRQRDVKPVTKEPKLRGSDVPPFPAIPGLELEKGIISQGILDINRALFEQSIHESQRLGKIRSILSSLEGELLDIDQIKMMDPSTRLRIFEALRKDSETTVNFLERMQRNSLQIMVIFEIYKKLVDAMDDKNAQSGTGLPADVDRGKVAEVKGVLIEMMRKVN